MIYEENIKKMDDLIDYIDDNYNIEEVRHKLLKRYNEEQIAGFEYIIEDLLSFIGEDYKREGLKETPRRVLLAWKEWTAGYKQDVSSVFKCFKDGSEKYDELIILDSIPVHSHCLPSRELVNKVGVGSVHANSVRVGDKLWTLSDRIPVETTVEEITIRKAYNMTTIELVNGKKITVTSDHPIKLFDRWEEAENLKVGDEVEYVNPKTLHKQQYEFNYNHPSFGYLIGALLSDGHIDNKMHVKLQVKDLKFAEKFKSAIKDVFNAEATIHRNDNKSGGFVEGKFTNYVCIISSSQIAKRLLKVIGFDRNYDGPKSFTFKVPKIIYNDILLFETFLAGYFDGDGHLYTDKKDGHQNIRISTVNKEFAYELCSILKNNPYVSTTIANNPIYTINIPPKSWKDRYFDWKLKHGFEQAELSLDFGESEFIAIKSITNTFKKTKVYAFKCKEYPTFLVQGILTHNCEHHLARIEGVCHIGYIPNKKVAGLSKFVRLVNIFAHRLQIQERLTTQIADAIQEYLNPLGCGVIIKASHACMSSRGVRADGILTTTSALRGVLLEPNNNSRAEFLSLINSK